MADGNIPTENTNELMVTAVFGDLHIFNGDEVEDSDALPTNDDDFLAKITLYSDDCDNTLSPPFCNCGNDGTLRYEENETMNEIANYSVEEKTHAMYHCLLYGDYTTFKVLVKEHNVDIDHVFELETYIEQQYKGWRLFHFACKRGELAGLQMIVSFGANPISRTCQGDTGLHIACRYGHYVIVKYLLEIVDTLKDVKNKEGMTPLLDLLCGCPRYDKENMYMESVKLLLEAGCNVNHVSDTQKSPLHTATRNWHTPKVIRLLIEAGANVDSVVLGNTPLLEAVKREVKPKINTQSVKLLIQAGASVNVRDQCGRSPLCYVARYGCLDRRLLECFLQAGIDTNLDCYKGLDLHLMRACLNKDFGMLQNLRLYEVCDKESRKQLMGDLFCCAVQSYNAELVRLFIENGDDINSKTYYGNTALQTAVRWNAVEIAEILIDNGADMKDTEDLCGFPLPCVAVDNINEAMTKLLLDKGADINEKSTAGLPAIHYAVYASVYGQNLSIMKLLLRRNCDLTSPPNLLLKAIDYGRIQAIKLLCEVGCPLPEPFVKIEERIKALGYQNEYLEWLYNFYHNPRTLQKLCVVNIRKHYGHKLLDFLDTLTQQKAIPMPLIDLILFKNVLK